MGGATQAAEQVRPDGVEQVVLIEVKAMEDRQGDIESLHSSIKEFLVSPAPASPKNGSSAFVHSSF